MFLLTFAVPCFNSASYMRKCIDSLVGKKDVEIIIIDDGSSDETLRIGQAYQDEYPENIRVITQPNGGHGGAVNTGLANARGEYFKVIDSDDWIDADSFNKVLETLRSSQNNSLSEDKIDLFICNYVYERIADNSRKVMDYHKIFPENRIFTWNEMGKWPISRYLLMHSVIYRTELLRECGIKLPCHTFYVDNIFVYQPLPYVKNLYYINTDFYRYFIGRSGQSVEKNIMIKNVDHQIRVTKAMASLHDIYEKDISEKLVQYMTNYFYIITTISCIFLILDGSREASRKKREMWKYIKKENDRLYKKVRYRFTNFVMNLPGSLCRMISKLVYYIVGEKFKLL